MKYPVLLPNIFNYPFTYESSLKLKIGDYINVPFGKKVITGVVWDKFENNDNKNFKVKSVIEKLNIDPLKKQTVNFLNWFSEYNLVPLGMTLKLHLLSGNGVEKKINLNMRIIKVNLVKRNLNFQTNKKKHLKI